MSTSFRQAVSSSGEYLWSNVANWTNGVPSDGSAVMFNVVGGGNPSGYDDIANLFLDSLSVTSGFAAVGASLEVGSVSFGSTVASVFSDTDLGAASATLTVDGFSGGVDGRVGAFGSNALTTVTSATDPGEIYQVDEGGELVLDAAPHGASGPVNAGFYYQDSHGLGELPSGTFAFRNPGSTVSSLIAGVAVGDSIALPGTDVASVTYGASSISVVTNLGTTTFSNVAYLIGSQPTGYTTSADPSGLERITFASQQSTGFQQGTATAGEYLWSSAGNWTSGLPVSGAAVTFNTGFGGNPSGYDDIANLFLDSLSVTSGFAAVGASLEVGSVSFGSTVASVFSDTDLGAVSATLTVDGFGGTINGRVGAFGADALTMVTSATDPGEIYQVDEGGELVLDAAPHGASGPVNAGFYYQDSHGLGELPSGTFAFRNPGSTVSSLIAGVAVGDSIALPGTDVASVTYGASSFSVVTNLGTTTFSNVAYVTGAKPNGYTVSTDPEGLERITFADQQGTSFQQSTLTAGEYLWSSAGNWTNGVPGDGAAVTFNTGFGGNPSGYDDIANLFLDSLSVTSGFAAVGASLEVGSVSFGSTVSSVFSDTDLGAASATLTVDGFSGGVDGRVGAFGANALTTVTSATDPGEIYQVDEGGELVLDAAPHGASGPVNAGFYYQDSHSLGMLASGTFAFRSPGSIVSSLIAGVTAGDSIALPGTDVASVTYGTSSISVVTNLGTTTFSNVAYSSGPELTGYTTSVDPSGLERITFASQQSTSFQQGTLTAGEYLWSSAGNWTNGVPTVGAAVTFNTGFGSNPTGYDDIANLFLDSLSVTSGFAAVGASLEVGSVSFGSTVASVFSDTDLGAASATLTVDGFSGTFDGRVGAFGANALTTVTSATDPGEIYQVDEGGELVLDAAPHGASGPVNAGFYYQDSHSLGTLPSGTFAFRNPGSTVSSLIAGVAIGDSIALPGTDVASVTYGADTLSVVTNLGTTTFSNVAYVSNSVFTGFTATADAATGLEQVTFAGYSTTSFQQVSASGGEYLWSTAANWTNGVPANGDGVEFNTGFGSNPSGYDDIADLTLANLAVTSGFVGVGSTLTVGAVSFGSTTASAFSDTDLGSPAATLTIDGFSGAINGRIGAFGANALTFVESATDPGEIYQVDEGGELVLAPAPSAPGPSNAGFYYQDSHGFGLLPSGTFAFLNPGSIVSSLIAGVAIGDSIALPGTSVSSVAFGAGTITVVTNLGTTTFSNASYLAGATPSAFTASADPEGLERVTFTTATSFLQTTTATVGELSQYLWSDATNWTNGVPVNGSTVTFNVSTASNPSGYDDIGNLFIDTLHLMKGYLAVGGTLTIGKLEFSEGGTRAIEANTLVNGGSAEVTIDAMVSANALVEAVGSNAVTTVLAAIDPGEIYQASSGGMVVLSAVRSTSQLDWNAGTIALKNPGTAITTALNNIAIGDALELPGTSVSSVTYGANSLTVVTSAGTTVFSDANYLAGSVPTGFSATPDPTTGLEEITFTLCFCAGTLIRTPDGDVPVEQLRIGDNVVTWSGQVRTITWIGNGRVLSTRGSRTAATPVIVRKGALADNVPDSDLRVTKGHSLYLDGALIPVEELINHRSILWDDRAQEVHIFHIELASHDVLVANGAPAESYRDDGNRWLFRNASAAWGLAPQSPCALVLNRGALVDAAWRYLLDRAAPRPALPLTDEADVHLLVDGKRLEPMERRDDMVVFRLVSRPRSVRLVSRAAVPQELGIARDPRMLGIAVGRIVLAQGKQSRAIDAGDARLSKGYHAFEPANCIRWTDGDAEVPRELFAGVSGASMLMVHLGASTRYPDEGKVRRVA